VSAHREGEPKGGQKKKETANPSSTHFLFYPKPFRTLKPDVAGRGGKIKKKKEKKRGKGTSQGVRAVKTWRRISHP